MSRLSSYKLSQGSSVILDLIRGISAQLVVIGHGLSFFGIFKFLHEPNFPWMQNIAVLVFFLLSGYLITYSVSRKLDKIEYSFRHYFIDRFSRIYTAFIPALFFVFLIDVVSMKMNPGAYTYGDGFSLQSFVGNIFMLQDYPLFVAAKENIVTSFGSARIFWTLAIEWWIYMFVGYFIIVFIREQRKKNIWNWLLLGFLSIVPLSNLILGRGNGLTTYWLMGAAIYFIDRQNLLSEVSRWMKWLLVILLSGVAMLRAYIEMEAYDAVFAFLLAIVLWLVIDLFRTITINEKSTKVIRFIASYSYTLYLIHYSILAFIKAHYASEYSGNPYLLFGASFLIANLASILIGHYTETKLTFLVKSKLYELNSGKS